MQIKDHGSVEKTMAVGRAIPDARFTGDSVCPLMPDATRVAEPKTCLEALTYVERQAWTCATDAIRRRCDREGAGQ
jgi:hypothetical protein